MVDVHLHCLVTDGAFEERAGELLFRPAPPPTPARMLAALTRVREAIAAAADDDDEIDVDTALAACGSPPERQTPPQSESLQHVPSGADAGGEEEVRDDHDTPPATRAGPASPPT